MLTLLAVVSLLAAPGGNPAGGRTADAAPQVFVRVLSANEEQPQPGQARAEAWIAEAIAAAGYPNCVPASDWIEVNGTRREVFASMMGGRVIHGIAEPRDGGLAVRFTGRAITPPADPLHVRPGQNMVVRLTSYQGKRNVFIAIRATSPLGRPDALTLPSGFAIEATIEGADAKAGTIAATWDDKKYIEPVRDNTKIALDGKEAKLADLQPGMKAWLHIVSKGDRYVLEIRATSVKK